MGASRAKVGALVRVVADDATVRAIVGFSLLLAIGPMARATFRTDNDAVTVVPGEWIGGRLVVAIGADGVTLADRGGARRHVVVGQRTPFD